MSKFGGHNVLCVCRSCGKKTHSNIDGCNLALCRACLEDSGMENDHNDGWHHPDENGFQANCPWCVAEKAKLATNGEK